MAGTGTRRRGGVRGGGRRCPVWELARLEPVLDRLLGRRTAGPGDHRRGRRLRRHTPCGDGAVGFKTVLAYRTGLAVDPEATLAAAERGLAADRAAGVPVRRSGKALRDLLFGRLLGALRRRGLSAAGAHRHG